MTDIRYRLHAAACAAARQCITREQLAALRLAIDLWRFEDPTATVFLGADHPLLDEFLEDRNASRGDAAFIVKKAIDETHDHAYLVVGSDGTRPVVWGRGETVDAAYADAAEHIDDEDENPNCKEDTLRILAIDTIGLDGVVSFDGRPGFTVEATPGGVAVMVRYDGTGDVARVVVR